MAFVEKNRGSLQRWFKEQGKPEEWAKKPKADKRNLIKKNAEMQVSFLFPLCFIFLLGISGTYFSVLFFSVCGELFYRRLTFVWFPRPG